MDQFEKKLWENRELLAQKNFYVSIGEEEWRHDFEETNYLPLSTSFEVWLKNYSSQKNFLKLAVRWPLSSVNEMEEKLKDHYDFLLRLAAGSQLLPKR